MEIGQNPLRIAPKDLYRQPSNFIFLAKSFLLDFAYVEYQI